MNSLKENAGLEKNKETNFESSRSGKGLSSGRSAKSGTQKRKQRSMEVYK